MRDGTVINEPTIKKMPGLGEESDNSSQNSITETKINQVLGNPPRDISEVRLSSGQSVTRISLSSLRGTANRGARTSQDKVRQAQVKARTGLPFKIGATIPPASRAVNLDSRMIAAEIQHTPKAQRAQAIANAPLTLQTRINTGCKVFQKIQDGTAHMPASTTDIRDLMTFLTAKAAQKTAYFSQGAFNLPDPDHKIRNFLDSCQEVYQRSSTHIKGFSDHPGCGHRGIDLKLPHGMGTLLYGGMGNGVMGTQGDRIFLKMESHGCRFSTLTKGKLDTQGPQSRGRRFLEDLWTSIRHGLGGLMTKLGLQKTEGTRKERVDKTVVKAYEALVNTAKGTGVPKMKEILSKDNPTDKETGHGIRTMMHNIEALLNSDHEPPLPENLKEAMQTFKQRMAGRYDHLDHRIGNEMVFDMNELNGTGNVKERIRDGQARTLVNQLVSIGSPDAMSPDDIKQIISTTYVLGSAFAPQEKDIKADQKMSALDKAVSGLTTDQKEHVKTLLTSDKVQDLTNELNERRRSDSVEVPGHQLSPGQENTIRALMYEAWETLLSLTLAAGGQIRTDGNYSRDQMTEIMEDIWETAQSFHGAYAQEQVQGYVQSKDIKERSALNMQIMTGEGVTAIGTSARALFPNGAPLMDSKEMNALAKIIAQQDLKINASDARDAQDKPANEGLAKELGLSKQFMDDFKRDGVRVNQQHYGGKNVQGDEELQRFVDATGGPEKALTASKLLTQKSEGIVFSIYTQRNNQDGQAMRDDSGDELRTKEQVSILNAFNEVVMQQARNGPNNSQTGGRRSLIINHDGSAVIRASANKGGADEISQNLEIEIKLSGLDSDAEVTEAKTAMIFSSND